MSVSIPLSYLLLNTSRVAAAGKRTERIAQWFQSLREAGLQPRWILTDKDLAEVTASQVVWPNANHQLCHWHALRSIEKRLKQKSKRRTAVNGSDSDDDLPADAGDRQGERWVHNLLAAEAIPEHLAFLHAEAEWINSHDPNDRPGGRLLSDDRITRLKEKCRRHFTAHPWVPTRGSDGAMLPGVTAPEEVLRRRHEIHSVAVKEILAWCRQEGSPGTFRYLWANWYRCAFGNRGPRWELVSLSWKDDMPISSTTMRIEAHWKHVKTSCLYDFKRPRLDFLLVLLSDKHYPDMLDNWNRVLSGRQPPRHYLTLKARWKEAGLKVEEDTQEHGVTTSRYRHREKKMRVLRALRA
jgi:hypothetical protein